MNQLEEHFLAEKPTIPNYVFNLDMEISVKKINGVDYMGARILSLELEQTGISQWSHPGFKIALCRYTGFACSGNYGNIVIYVHNY